MSDRKTIRLLGKEPFNVKELERTYFNTAEKAGLINQTWEYSQVYYPSDSRGRLAKTVKADLAKEWISENKHLLDSADVILCSDAFYFKVLTKQNKTEATVGQCLDSPFIKPKVMYIPSIGMKYFKGDIILDTIQFVMNQCKDYLFGSFLSTGTNIISSKSYPKTISDIRNAMVLLNSKNVLYVDLEAFSLYVTKAGIATIAFSWDKHNGIAFPVDLNQEPKQARKLLKEFLVQYQGKLVFHKCNYDVAVLIYVLFMNEDLSDKVGLLEGLDCLCPKLEDTLLIAYLATNSCGGNVLGLKQLAARFAGNWAVEVNDIARIPLDDLLKYNLIDTLSTAFVYETYYPKMVADQQETFYKEIFLPVLRDNIHCQLTGLPIDIDEVKKLAESLNQEESELLAWFNGREEIEKAEYILAVQATEKRNSKLKTKVTTIADNPVTFNFGSTKHLAVLLYQVLGLPVIDKTDSGEPSTDKGTLDKLKSHTEMETYKEMLSKLISLADVRKISSSFIPAFLNADRDKLGNYYLLGYLNLGGTVSGRLSSSQPNLQNLPATGSRFAKPVKKCFKSNDEWIFVGADFSSLEDKISALTTKDPNKLKVYSQGYDSHSLRACYYFPELHHIDTNDVHAVNAIADTHKHLRQKSKAPTFALTYQGTYTTLMQNCGFTEKEAKQIESAYHELYKVSDEWVQSKLNQARQDGYVTVAFGLRVRTPVLAHSPDNPMGKAEGRTAGNALGQSWGLLNDRAMNAVMQRVHNSKYKGMVHPCVKIHDAAYYLVRNNAELLSWFNSVVVEESRWQNHPDIAHDEVHLGGDLEVFYPDWSNGISLPNNINPVDLVNLMNEKVKK